MFRIARLGQGYQRGAGWVGGLTEGAINGLPIRGRGDGSVALGRLKRLRSFVLALRRFNLGQYVCFDRPSIDQKGNRQGGDESSHSEQECILLNKRYVALVCDADSHPCHGAKGCSDNEASHGSNQKEDDPGFEVFRFCIHCVGSRFFSGLAARLESSSLRILRRTSSGRELFSQLICRLWWYRSVPSSS